MSAIRVEASEFIGNGTLCAIGSDGRVFNIDIGNDVDRTSVVIGTAIEDSREDGTVDIRIHDVYDIYNRMIIENGDIGIGGITPEYLLNLSDIEENIEKEEIIEKINMKNNKEIAEDRLNAIFEN